MKSSEPRSQWSSFSSYVMVTTGAVVGLSNFFQFPFLVSKYGGLFVLFFVLCLVLVGLPLLFAALLIGRRGKQNPVGSIKLLAMESDANLHWGKLGWLSFVVVFFTLCYYTVAAAFPVGYFLDGIKELFFQSNAMNASVALNTGIMTNFYQLEACFLLFIVLAMMVVYRGINRGLETISCITVPAYCIILVLLAIYVSTQGYFGESWAGLVAMPVDVPVKEVFLAALALAFLNYNVGMGMMIVYGSYLPYHVPLNQSTLMIVLIDIVVSLLAYFIVYPLMLASSANGFVMVLSSENVINVFSAVPHGLIISVFFFFAAILAAWTPIIAMAETAVITLVERLNFSRHAACMVILTGVLVIGTLEVLSHLQGIDTTTVGGYSLHNVLKNLTQDILTPVSALLMAVFAGWALKRYVTEDELDFKPIFYWLWRFLIRFVVPVSIFVVLVTVTILEKMSF